MAIREDRGDRTVAQPSMKATEASHPEVSLTVGDFRQSPARKSSGHRSPIRIEGTAAMTGAPARKHGTFSFSTRKAVASVGSSTEIGIWCRGTNWRTARTKAPAGAFRWLSSSTSSGKTPTRTVASPGTTAAYWPSPPRTAPGWSSYPRIGKVTDFIHVNSVRVLVCFSVGDSLKAAEVDLARRALVAVTDLSVTPVRSAE